MKAMILAAGRGERLRPLTDRVPKPLVEVGGKPLIVRHIERLAAAGFREIVVNVSHLARAILERLGDGSAFGVRIAWSSELEPLEVAGGIATARPVLGAAPFALVNGDVYTDYDFSVLRRHTLRGQLAHLVLVPNPAHHTQGDFSLESGRIGTSAAPRYTYSGLAIIDPMLVESVRAGEKAPLAPRLFDVAARNMASGELFTGRWHDVGSIERLAELNAILRAQPGCKPQDKEQE